MTSTWRRPRGVARLARLGREDGIAEQQHEVAPHAQRQGHVAVGVEGPLEMVANVAGEAKKRAQRGVVVADRVAVGGGDLKAVFVVQHETSGCRACLLRIRQSY